jgi:hypothetical protein
VCAKAARRTLVKFTPVFKKLFRGDELRVEQKKLEKAIRGDQNITHLFFSLNKFWKVV